MRYPTRAEILVLHRAMLEQSGGTPGIRDLGARHAALAQPRRHPYFSTLVVGAM